MNFVRLFLLVSLQTFNIQAWTSQKCLVFYDDDLHGDSEGMLLRGCPRSNITLVCKDVTDLEKDLLGIVADIQVLCIWMDSRTSLHLNAISRFHSVESMYIYGCFSAILPQTLKGLNNLRTLSMISLYKCNTSISASVFGDLYTLEKLSFFNYTLSEMAKDVFDGLIGLKEFTFSGDNDFPDLLCKLSFLSNAVEYVHIIMETSVALSAPNSTVCPHNFSALKTLELNFPNVRWIEENALAYFKKVSYLKIPMSDTLQLFLLNSGIKKLDRLEVIQGETNLTSLCHIVSALSVTYVTLHTLPENLESIKAKCYSLVGITLRGPSISSLDLSFLSSLRNLSTFIIEAYTSIKEFEDHSLTSLCVKEVPLTHLSHFTYMTGQDLELGSKRLICLNNLQSLHLEGRITQIECDTFKGLSNLRHLKVKTHYTTGHTKAENTKNVVLNESIPQHFKIGIGTFRGLTRLESLVFTGNLLTIKKGYFLDLINLLVLNLLSCKIHTIENFAFADLKRLKTLVLTSNRISKINASTFGGLVSLETLLIDTNPLKSIETSSFAYFSQLKTLHIDNLSTLNLTAVFSHGVPQLLSDLSINSAFEPMTLVLADSSTLDTGLHVSLWSPTITLCGCERSLLKSVNRLRVVANHFVCAADNVVALKHFTSVIDLKFTQWDSAIVQDLSGLQHLKLLKRLVLGNVNIDNQPHFEVMFHGLTNLVSLELMMCSVSFLGGSVSTDMTALRSLAIYSSSEITISREFFEPLSKLRCVSLTSPQLLCNCENFEFYDWAKQEAKVEVLFVTKQHKSMTCLDDGKREDLDLYGLSHCRPEIEFDLYIVITGTLLLFILSVLLYQHQSNTRGRYCFDVYMSYSGKDESWINDWFLPRLKQRSSPHLRICFSQKLHQPGKDIVENITNSLYRSRRTLCLISRHYLRSNWCSLEMRLATYRLQVEYRDVLILLFLEKIPPRLLSAHHGLARLVKTRTYIDWPQDPAQHQAFWDSLWENIEC